VIVPIAQRVRHDEAVLATGQRQPPADLGWIKERQNGRLHEQVDFMIYYRSHRKIDAVPEWRICWGTTADLDFS
jgi:hypothetical protein